MLIRLATGALAVVLAAVMSGCVDEIREPTPGPATGTASPTPEPYVDLKATEIARATPTPTPVPATATCPSGTDTARACSEALGLAEAIRRDGVEGLIRAAGVISVTCGPDRGWLEVICDNVPAGETREGMIYGNKSLLLLPEDRYRESLASRPLKDSRIVALGCPPAPSGALSCTEGFMIALDPSPRDPPDHYRLLALFVVWRGEGRAAILANYTGLYASYHAWAGGPGRYPLPGGSYDTLAVWWQPWRP